MPESVPANGFASLLNPEDVAREHLEPSALASGMIARAVCRIKRVADDPWFWAELSASRLPDGGAQIILRDI